jgi:hypothetical protein
LRMALFTLVPRTIACMRWLPDGFWREAGRKDAGE